MSMVRRSRSIYHIVLIPLLAMFLLVTAVIAAVPIVSGIASKLDNNEEELLRQHAVYRKSQLQSDMGTNWGDLDRLGSVVNSAAEALMEREEVSMEQVTASTALCDELLMEVAQELVTELYIRRVNGIYLILNTQDLAPLREQDAMPRCSGLCIYDIDPLATPSQQYMDLTFRRAPIAVVREMNISTAVSWQPMFCFEEGEERENYDFLYTPFQTAYEAEMVDDPSHYGYWTLATATWCGEEGEKVVTYSQPLVLADGTVYGVLGIELGESYFSTLLPHEELARGDDGSYLFAQIGRSEGEIELHERLLSSAVLDAEALPSGSTLSVGEDGRVWCWVDGVKYYVEVQTLSPYGSSTPYPTEEWALLGLVREDTLYYASSNLARIIGAAALLTLAVGLLGSIVVAERLSHPVLRLASEVDAAQKKRSDTVPRLTRSNIEEVDRFADAFTKLSDDLVKSSSRFLRIVTMASGEIGGFEIPAQGETFVTENFCAMLGIEEGTPLTAQTIEGQLAYLREEVPWIKWNNGSDVFEFTAPDGTTRYINVAVREEEGSLVGLAEDVTALMTERKRIEHDRDYDLLTGLLNRRAFYGKVERLFREDRRSGRCGAVVMLDLDHLKEINDRYGHEWGDQYLRSAAWGFATALPKQSVLARLSGDEFAALIHGCESEQEVERALEEFSEQSRSNTITVSDGSERRVSVSGGTAIYPREGNDFYELMKYADFALYQVKREGKDAVKPFEREKYQQEMYLARNRQDLQQLIEKRLVEYYFQPIFSAADGTVFAYEALMRVDMPTLRSPMAVLNLAREENRMNEIERLTMECATERYAALWAKGLVRREAYLFINSIADQWLEEEVQERIGERIAVIADRIVIEITEHNETDEVALEKKRRMPWFSGLFALDDYGTGYSGEKNLLELSPRFVKLDICLVRGLDGDENKQQIVSNLLGFAHRRGMMVVAEGLETMSEIRTALELGVDLLQGYALARPGAEPKELSQEAAEVIRAFHAERRDDGAV